MKGSDASLWNPFTLTDRRDALSEQDLKLASHSVEIHAVNLANAHNKQLSLARETDTLKDHQAGLPGTNKAKL